MNYIKNEPVADILMTSMRAMDYSFETAIADIIDNSITAEATSIKVIFPQSPNEEQSIAICDNGIGMDRNTLLMAMRYGSTSPLEKRTLKDLGRFGLGLKAASLSQCKTLIVISKQHNNLNGFMWDIDTISQKQDWLMAELSHDEIVASSYYKHISNIPSGTIVIWNQLDSIQKRNKSTFEVLHKYKKIVGEHLSTTFHRYMNGETTPKIEIQINNNILKPADPFLESHKKTNVKRTIRIPIIDDAGNEHIIEATPYVLPYKKYLSESDKILSGGIEHYTSKQGFYIYRNKRLIKMGGWSGKKPSSELTKYARIKIDIPNTLDDVWDIDIKKQNAKIPPYILNKLLTAIEDALNESTNMQTYRGRRMDDEDKSCVWNITQDRDGSFNYIINIESPLIQTFISKLGDKETDQFKTILRIIENNLPIHQIYVDCSKDKINDEKQNQEEDIKNLISSLIEDIPKNQRPFFLDTLFLSEPFCDYRELKNHFMQGENNDE